MGWPTDLWDFFRRLTRSGQTTEWDTTSEPGYTGDVAAPAVDVVSANFGSTMEHLMRDLVWRNGWYEGARWVDAHPGRVGGLIVPRTVVVHTTDMLNGFSALVRAWPGTAGKGNGAHFLLGRTPEEGLVQFAPITRNANHAGGAPAHGWFREPGGKQHHPNLVAIGVEVDNAGRLRNKGTNTQPRLVHPESGRSVSVTDAYYHEATRTWWHMWTPYQQSELRKLLSACLISLKDFPAGTAVVPNGTYAGNGVRWAELKGVNVVGHVTLDPTRKTDPGPAITGWLRDTF